MLQILIEVVTAIVLFGGGVLVGAHNAVSVDKAISIVEAAEKTAVANLSKIGAHKATVTTTVTTPPAA